MGRHQLGAILNKVNSWTAHTFYRAITYRAWFIGAKRRVRCVSYVARNLKRCPIRLRAALLFMMLSPKRMTLPSAEGLYGLVPAECIALLLAPGSDQDLAVTDRRL